MYLSYVSIFLLPCSGKLSREKTFANFAVLWLFTKVFFSPRNLGHGVLRQGKSEQSAKVFSTKIVFSPIRESFLPQKFPGIWYLCMLVSSFSLHFAWLTRKLLSWITRAFIHPDNTTVKMLFSEFFCVLVRYIVITRMYSVHV